MGCNCKKGKERFVWTSDDGKTQVVYTSLAAVKMKIKRKGGTYRPEGKA